MRRTPTARRHFARFVTALVMMLGVPATTAFAHASLDNSVPPSGATLVDSPPQIVLDFDENVETALGFIRLFSSEGKRINLPRIARDAADESIVRVDVPRLDDDTYVVTYRVVSVDGALTFQLGDGPKVDVADVIAGALADSGTDGTVRTAMRVVRLIGYLALALVLAAALFLLGGVAAGGVVRRLRHVAAVSAAGLVLASAGLLALQGATLAGGGVGSATKWSTITEVADTRVGHALLLRMLVAASLAIAAWVPGRTSILRFFAVLGFAVLPLSYSFAGHAGSASPSAVAVVVSMLHVAVVSTWFGGLVVLVSVSALRDHTTVKWFSQRAVVTVGLAVATGIAQSILIVDDIRHALDISYGKVLASKIIVVGVMLLAAAVVRRRFLDSGTQRLRSVLLVEAVVGLFVLGITAGLVAETPRVTASSAPFATTLVQGETLVNVTVAPARVGSVEMHVIVTKPGGSLSPVASAKLRLSSNERSVPPIGIEPAEVGPNHFVATGQIPFAGEWKIDVILVEGDGRESLFTTTFDARP